MTYQQAYNGALKYFNGNELAANVWVTKYAMRDKNGNFEEFDPSYMHKRMATQFAKIEDRFQSKLKFHDILSLLSGFGRIIPQGSVMAMLGNFHSVGSLSNCVVLPKLYDSYGGILMADQQLVQLMKRRCGVGLDISTLRPEGTGVANAAQTSTGGVSFMHRFSNSTREVAQGGRRGALMITCDIRYPDVEKFVTIKQDLSKVTGANVSIRLRDDFMQAVLNEENYTLCFPVDDPENAKITKEIKARELWNKIIDCAWNTAEPGLIFWDRQHWYSPSSIYEEFENISTNPCSEIAMGNDSCRLIAANVVFHVVNPFTKEAYFDHDLWYDTCYKGMYLMDDLVELELDAIRRIREKIIQKDEEPEFIKEDELRIWDDLYASGERGRRTGFGLTALGDSIAAIGLQYNSPEAFLFVDKLMKTKLKAELDAMMDMAEERGAFPAWDKNLEADLSLEEGTFFEMLRIEFPKEWKRMQKVGRRNISWSTVAPTGTLSLLTQIIENHYGTTSGIEPLFATHHTRRKKIVHNDESARVDFVDATGDQWQHFNVYHNGILAWAKANGVDQNDLSGNPYIGSTANEIDWIKRVELQAIIQKYTTHSISSTINLPKDVSVDTVSNIYFEAWKQGLKGITVYRDGCRDGVLVTENEPEKEKFEYRDAPKRPKSLLCDIYHTKVKGNDFTVIVGLFDSKPYEVFAFEGILAKGVEKGALSKKSSGNYSLSYEDTDDLHVQPNIGSSMTDEEAALTRMISTALRHGADIKFVVEQLGKIEGNITSFSKAVARTLKRYVPDQELAKRAKCRDCGSTNLIFEEGCSKCRDCGSSKCS